MSNIGAKAFFPDDVTRKSQLLRMLKDINVRTNADAKSTIYLYATYIFMFQEFSNLYSVPLLAS